MEKVVHYYLHGEMSFDLPASHVREIGRIVVRWAYLEHQTQTIIHNLARLTNPFGRIVARQPRLEDRLVMIEQLTELHGIPVNSEILKSLREGTRLISAKRDAVVHGFWHKQPDGWHLGVSRGKWQDADAPTQHKTILPESVVITDAELSVLRDGIEALINLMDVVTRQVLQKLQPPPEVHPEQYHRKNRAPNPSPSKPAPRRRQQQAKS